MDATPCARCGTFLPVEQELSEGQEAICASCESLRDDKAVRWLRWLSIGTTAHSILIVPLLLSHGLTLWSLTNRSSFDPEWDPETGWVIYAFYAGLLLMISSAMVGQLVAGVQLLRRRPGARKLAVFAYFLGLGLLMTVWCAPTSLFLLIAGLKILDDKDVRAHMETWA